jgi:RimJ/RimL family protein N-acetyltransferase
VIVRPAVPADARGYIALIKGILAETPPVDTPYAPGEFNPPTSVIRDLIIEYNAAPNGLFLVAESGGVIGALSCRGGSLLADRHTTDLGVYVEKNARNQGVGGALLRGAVEWAAASPVVERVELEVFAGNARAIHLYEKFGFEREGVKRRKYYRGGAAIDMLIMALLLDKS